MVLGEISISFYAAAAGVVRHVLERLGQAFEVRQGLHGEMFPLLASGEIDMLVAAWLPHGHANFWSRYGRDAAPVGVLYRGAQFFWMVPRYVPDESVACVPDLIRPEVLARMDKRIPGLAPDIGLMINSARMMEAYGLSAAGYRLLPGDYAGWIGNYERALAENRWFIMPQWKPQFVNRMHTMRTLEEPLGLLGAPNEGTLVARKDWIARAPAETLRVLGRMHLGLDAVSEMDYFVNVEKLPPVDAAQKWIGMNRGVVDGWFAA